MKFLLLSILLNIFLYADTLLVEDKANHVVLVQTPKVYYTSKTSSSLNLFYVPDYETEGIRLQEGMGISFVKWADINSIDLHKAKDKKVFFATLHNDKSNLSVLLVNPSGGFFAKSNFGDFSIDFKNIKKINVVKKEHMEIETFLIRQYFSMPKEVLPDSIKIKNDKKLIAFASKKLKLKKEQLKIMRYAQYIIIHFDDEEYEKKHPLFKDRKYGESLIINTAHMNFVFFRMSKT